MIVGTATAPMNRLLTCDDAVPNAPFGAGNTRSRAVHDGKVASRRRTPSAPPIARLGGSAQAHVPDRRQPLGNTAPTRAARWHAV